MNRLYPTLAPLLALLALCALHVPAGAHAYLSATDPPLGAALESAPEAVRLTFTEAVEAGLSAFRLARQGEAERDVPFELSQQDRTVVVSLPAELPDGAYELHWKTVSAVDGHAGRGIVPFFVGVAPTAGTATEVSTAVAAPAALQVAARWLGLLGLLLLGGAAAWSTGLPARLAPGAEQRWRVALALSATLFALAAAGRICRLTGGAPLAIELAASWVRALSCETLAEGLAQQLDFLKDPDGRRSERHRSIRAVFEQSWHALSERERDVLPQLGVFVGSFEPEAARRVARAAPSELMGLLDKSLLRHAEGARLTMNELLRQFASGKLAERADGGTAIRARHAEWVAELLAGAAKRMRGKAQRDALRRVRQELGNVWAAWRWALEARRTDLLERALAGLYPFFDIQSRFSEGKGCLDQALEALDREPQRNRHPALLGKLLSRKACFTHRLGAYDRAGLLLDQALALAREAGDAAEEAFCLNNLGVVAWKSGQYGRAKAFLEQSLALRRALGDTRGMATCLNNLGSVHGLLGEYERARRLFERSLTHQRRDEDRTGTASTLINLGAVANTLGDYERARALYEESLAICRALGDRYRAAAALTNLGNVCIDLGEYERARRYHAEALRLREQIGYRTGQATTLHKLGYVYALLGEHARAEGTYERSLSLAREVGDHGCVAASLNNLGLLACERDQLEQAERLAHEALELRQDLDDRWGVADSLYLLGQVHRRRGRTDRARAAFRQALDLARALDTRPQVLENAAGLAGLAWDRGDPARAATLAGWVQAHPQADRETRAAADALLEVISAEHARAEAWRARGASLPLAEALALAHGA